MQHKDKFPNMWFSLVANLRKSKVNVILRMDLGIINKLCVGDCIYLVVVECISIILQFSFQKDFHYNWTGIILNRILEPNYK